MAKELLLTHPAADVTLKCDIIASRTDIAGVLLVSYSFEAMIGQSLFGGGV